MGKSGHIGRKFSASLSSTGTPSFFVHPAEASHGDLGMITQNDVVICISNSGEARELVNVISFCKRYGIFVCAITKDRLSTLGKASDAIILLPDCEEADTLGLAPTNSTTATLVICDVITILLMERRHFTAQDFNDRHPGGQLGSLFRTIGSVMRTGKKIPVIGVDCSIDDALCVMSDKQSEIVGVVNQSNGFVGVIKGIDLLKLCGLSKDDTIEKFIDNSPIVISPELFAAGALKIMNENDLNEIFVVSNNQVVGFVDIHDLLKIGVA